MAILEIKKYPAPILRKKSEEVKEITPKIKKLAKDMAETLLKSEPEGIGLAAPQVGELKRLIAVRTKNGPLVLINPKIIKKTKKQDLMEEGCLSLPGVWLKIKRACGVEAEAIDKKGKKIKIKTEGFLARILQHEIDHLDGVLIIDRVNFFQRFRLFKKKGGKQ